MKKFMGEAAKRRAINYLAPFWLGGFKASVIRGWRGGWPPEVLFIIVMVMSLTLPLPRQGSEADAATAVLKLVPFSMLWGVVALFLWRSAHQNQNTLWRLVFKVYGATMLFIAVLMFTMVGMLGIVAIL